MTCDDAKHIAPRRGAAPTPELIAVSVKQGALSNFAKLFELDFPVERQGSRIPARSNALENLARTDQREGLIELEILRKQFVEGRGEFGAEFGRVERLTVEENNAHTVTDFSFELVA